MYFRRGFSRHWNECNSSAFGLAVTESAPFQVCQGQRGGFSGYLTLLAVNCAAGAQLQAEMLRMNCIFQKKHLLCIGDLWYNHLSEI